MKIKILFIFYTFLSILTSCVKEEELFMGNLTPEVETTLITNSEAILKIHVPNSEHNAKFIINQAYAIPIGEGVSKSGKITYASNVHFICFTGLQPDTTYILEIEVTPYDLSGDYVMDNSIDIIVKDFTFTTLNDDDTQTLPDDFFDINYETQFLDNNSMLFNVVVKTTEESNLKFYERNENNLYDYTNTYQGTKIIALYSDKELTHFVDGNLIHSNESAIFGNLKSDTDYFINVYADDFKLFFSPKVGYQECKIGPFEDILLNPEPIKIHTPDFSQINGEIFDVKYTNKEISPNSISLSASLATKNGYMFNFDGNSILMDLECYSDENLTNKVGYSQFFANINNNTNSRNGDVRTKSLPSETAKIYDLIPGKKYYCVLRTYSDLCKLKYKDTTFSLNDMIIKESFFEFVTPSE